MAKKWRSKKTKKGKTIRFPLKSRQVSASQKRDVHKQSIKTAEVPEEIVKPTMTKEEFRRGYVDAYYPGLTGYGYQAEMITESEAKKIMNDILKDVVRIEEYGHTPVLVMKDGRRLWATDTDDFPVPTAEEFEDEEEW